MDVKISPDLEPDAEPWTFAMQCAVCEEQSEAAEAFDPGQDWTLKHIAANPEHYSYREIITRPYRAIPTSGESQ